MLLACPPVRKSKYGQRDPAEWPRPPDDKASVKANTGSVQRLAGDGGGQPCGLLSDMPVSFRNGVYAGLLVAAIAGIWLATLWRPERQVRLHTADLLSQIEKKNWRAVGEFIGDDYQDRWGNDRSLALNRIRRVFGVLPNPRVEAGDAQVRTENRQGYWQAKITVKGSASEFTALIEERVNSLPAPFELEWRRRSSKPWDWTLVCVRNEALEISDAGL